MFFDRLASPYPATSQLPLPHEKTTTWRASPPLLRIWMDGSRDYKLPVSTQLGLDTSTNKCNLEEQYYGGGEE